MKAIAAEAVFDGTTLHEAWAVGIAEGRIAALGPSEAFRSVETVGAGILAPGLVDLQVNGGGGVMLGDDPTPETIRRMMDAHARLGATTIVPTLITDTPETTRAAIEAARAVPDLVGLHLEGPHLSVARKGAHDGTLIRSMTEADEALYVEAAQALRCLKITVAPESVTPQQVKRLTEAGCLVSLGHSDAPYEACAALIAAGARCVTHLFNAMSQMQGRAAGLAGAALDHGGVDVGMIADGVHVAPVMMAMALRAKRGPGAVFLVSDAMAVAGTAMEAFTLGGRVIRRSEGRLTLADGTLAGADLDLARAVRTVEAAGASRSHALAMATSIPARVIGAEAGRLAVGAAADLVWLDADMHLRAVWKDGARL